MKIKQEIELGVTAKAVLRNGELSLSVTGTVPYGPKGERLVTVTHDDFDAKLRKKAEALLSEAITAAIEGGIVNRATAESHGAYLVAQAQGEF